MAEGRARGGEAALTLPDLATGLMNKHLHMLLLRMQKSKGKRQQSPPALLCLPPPPSLGLLLQGCLWARWDLCSLNQGPCGWACGGWSCIILEVT